MDSQTKSSKVASTIAEIKGIPTREELIEQLEKNILTVRFTKLDGDERVMTCTLLEEFKPPAKKDDAISQKKVRDVSDKVIVAYDVNAMGWRSFRYERVLEVWMDADEILKARLRLEGGSFSG